MLVKIQRNFLFFSILYYFNYQALTASTHPAITCSKLTSNVALRLQCRLSLANSFDVRKMQCNDFVKKNAIICVVYSIHTIHFTAIENKKKIFAHCRHSISWKEDLAVQIIRKILSCISGFIKRSRYRWNRYMHHLRCG